MTNYERIKNMSIEEMARKISEGILSDVCDYCPDNEYHCAGDSCSYLKETEIIENWLKRETEE